MRTDYMLLNLLDRMIMSKAVTIPQTGFKCGVSRGRIRLRTSSSSKLTVREAINQFLDEQNQPKKGQKNAKDS